MLKIDNLTFAYPGQAKPYSYSLQVNPAQITLISGPSGEGKSTLLDLVAGFLKPISGTLRLDQIDLLPAPPEERPVSILFQADNLFEHLSVAANLSLGLPKGEASQGLINQALSAVELKDYNARRCNTLSGGQKQRVALARTMLRNRSILLLDEPFSGLDTKTAAAMRKLVRTLVTQNNWHCLVVSHDAEDAAGFADAHHEVRNATLTELPL